MILKFLYPPPLPRHKHCYIENGKEVKTNKQNKKHNIQKVAKVYCSLNNHPAMCESLNKNHQNKDELKNNKCPSNTKVSKMYMKQKKQKSHFAEQQEAKLTISINTICSKKHKTKY